MSDTFLGKPVKKVVIVSSERFVPEGKNEPVQVYPKKAIDIVNEDLSEKILYLMPKTGDLKNQIFYVYF